MLALLQLVGPANFWWLKHQTKTPPAKEQKPAKKNRQIFKIGKNSGVFGHADPEFDIHFFDSGMYEALLPRLCKLYQDYKIYRLFAF